MARKCVYCRKQKKRCTPADRKWPEKCDWCIKFRHPCSERIEAGTVDTIPKPLAVKIEFRPTVKIIEDFDCLLYLLAGLLDYDDWHFKIPATNGMPKCTVINYFDYHHPYNGKALLYMNFDKFRAARNARKLDLELALQRVREEAENVVEYYTSKNRFYEASALMNLMTASPEIYTTKVLEMRNAARLAHPQYLANVTQNEKACGQLFLYIKAATIPSNRINVCVPQYQDFLTAEERIGIFDLLMHNLYPINKRTTELTYTYQSIDPVWHRAYYLSNYDSPLREMLHLRPGIFWQRNLLGETGVHMALRRNLFDALDALPFFFEEDVESEDMSFPDIRGMDILMASMFYQTSNKILPIISKSYLALRFENMRIGCFFSPQEIGSSVVIQQTFPQLLSSEWTHIDPYQLMTVFGNLHSIDELDNTVASTGLSLSRLVDYMESPTGSYRILYRHLQSVEPLDGLETFHPIIISALSRRFDIVVHYINKYPAFTRQEGEGGYLESILVALLEAGVLEMLEGLSTRIQKINVNILVHLTAYAAAMATPFTFFRAFDLFWFDLVVGIYHGKLSAVCCAVTRDVLGSLCARYPIGDPHISEIQEDEKQQFKDHIYEKPLCHCANCQIQWQHFHTTFGVSQASLEL
ncbi:hypothetical protein TWF694_010350 [Orbilia ellipsospora]|uniref:Zn(2)-C6 fungal-type domain-containing protein n=1 Tax=Orbilia ellipsospora TaxID=2528407 RepID=A0AAV9XAT1_9PEZI